MPEVIHMPILQCVLYHVMITTLNTMTASLANLPYMLVKNV